MASVRIRWRGVARVAAIVLVGLIALRLLPGLLRTPEPPPLAADVGLPQAKPVTAARRHARRSRTRPARDAPASVAVIGTHHKHRVEKPVKPPPPPPDSVAESTPPPVPEYVPPPSPEASPEPPQDAPTTPGDGSEEFAPH